MEDLRALYQARHQSPMSFEAWDAFIAQHEGDVRDYLATQDEIAQTALDDEQAKSLRQALIKQRQALPAQTIKLLDQPLMLRANATPYAQAWWSVGLGEFRPEHGTYTCYPYASLPPLPESLDLCDFSYMDRDDPEPEQAQEVLDWLAYIEQSAQQKGLTLPQDFVSFFKEPKNLNGINSCTDCFFDLEEDFCKDPTGSGAYLLRFYADSQGCLFWYLYLSPTGYSAILVGDYLDELGQDEPVSATEVPAQLCSPSFGEFIWRFWIENELWDLVAYAEGDDYEGELLDEERAYLEYLAHFADELDAYQAAQEDEE